MSIQVAWNSQVSHILATSAGNGTVTVWDLNQKKAWCELRCESSGASVSDMAWNPSEGLHLLTASSDDRNPAIKLWDLRASTTMPLATLQGHQQGILCMAWCPHDESLVISSGKDNRTLLWDLHSMTCVAELPNEPDPAAEATQGSASNVYGSSLSSSQTKRYDIQWSPLIRGVVSTCSFDRKVQAHSTLGVSTKCGRPPKWLKTPSGVSFGFGGTIVSFGSSHRGVTIDTIVEEHALVAASGRFEQGISGGSYVAYCDAMAHEATNVGDTYEAQLWSFMKIVFEPNAREQLLQYLGFDAEQIQQVAMGVSDDPAEAVVGLSLASKSMSKEAEDAVKRALLVGNFEAAVECCFRNGNKADALILASSGGDDLWIKTQSRYFEEEAKKRPFLSMVSAILKNQLESLVQESDPASWHETLAVLSTYAKSEEFFPLCVALGEHLEKAGDAANATLCFVCGLQLEKAVKYLRIQLEASNEANVGNNLLALQAFVEKVTVFSQASGPSTQLDEETAAVIAEYAEALANQGLLATAAKYCQSSSQDCRELSDRLYRSKESPSCLQAMGSPPDFPYSMVNVGVSRGTVYVPQKQDQHQLLAAPQPEQNATDNNDASQRSSQHLQHSAPAAASVTRTTAPDSALDRLPPDWMELQDPASGRAYYYNQNTQETAWDKPKAQPVLSPAPAPSRLAAPHQPTSAPVSTSQPVANGGINLASKYGDGFVTSASHPELAAQYGNVGTSGAYMGAARPGTAVFGKTEDAPSSGPVNLNQPPEVSAEYKPTVDGLIAFVTYFKSLQFNTVGKKQVAEIELGVGILVKKISRGQISSESISSVAIILESLQNRDFSGAMKTQTELVNTHWREHKDWLKGLKYLIQVASKHSG